MHQTQLFVSYCTKTRAAADRFPTQIGENFGFCVRQQSGEGLLGIGSFDCPRNTRGDGMKQPRQTPARRETNDSAALAAHCARKLLDLRAHTQETQKQLAQRLRMTESMISRLERGDHVPSLKTLCRIADAFGRHLEMCSTSMSTPMPMASVIPILTAMIRTTRMITGTTNDLRTEALLVGAVAVVGVLHTIVPDHWVPITLIARQQAWSKGETARASLQAATGHVLSHCLLPQSYGWPGWHSQSAFSVKSSTRFRAWR